MKFSLYLILFFFAIFLAPSFALAASLTLNPQGGDLVVGSIFDISILLDTENQSVNAIEASLSFPPDKLQLVSPTTQKSVVGIWTAQPKFNNAIGRVDLQGGIPGGVNLSNGLITTLTFRVRGVGSAILKFLDNSKVLLNDGLGTDVLRRTQSGVYNFVLPPPEGPIVASRTHPDESKWYSKSFVILDWASTLADIEGYSYVLNEDPIDVPDNISEGLNTRVAYQSVSGGTHYFHIKSRRSGLWGGVTHFAVNVDTTPPAEFQIELLPFDRTVRRQPIIQFFTTDANSGLSHYEIKLIKVSPPANQSEVAPKFDEQFFVETQSPYLPPPLDVGDYDVIVRAYDNAGSFREVTKRLEIRQAIFEFLGPDGIQLRSRLIIPWPIIWVLGAALMLGLGFVALRLKRWHHVHDLKVANGHLPDHVKIQLDELKRYRQKYGKHLLLFLIFSGFLFSGIIAHSVSAETTSLAPPLVTTVSRNITNEEIFYIGGKTEAAGTDVVIYLQNLQTGETLSQTVESHKRGEWFYRHSNFLSVGNYLIWTQSKSGDEFSPPSPQIQMAVRQTAIQFGASRLSYETLYLILTIILFIGVIALGWYVGFHAVRARRKQASFLKEVREAEESVRRGFAVLRRDIQAELAVIKKVKLSKNISAEERVKEEQLLRDLDWVEKYVGKEIWDVEHI